MNKIIVFAVCVIVAWVFFKPVGSVSLGPGIMVSEEPIQEAIASPERRQYRDFTIIDQAKFSLSAKVLGREDYHLGREADLSPVDLALGWGKMSDESVLQHIDISQRGRFYYWQVESFPIPRREIETHSANMHLIPATEAVRITIDDVREGDIIELSGSLVSVEAENGNWRWNSSLTRNDTGAGACELIWVESFRIITHQYQ